MNINYVQIPSWVVYSSSLYKHIVYQGGYIEVLVDSISTHCNYASDSVSQET